jgi:hypothetical protein
LVDLEKVRLVPPMDVPTKSDMYFIDRTVLVKGTLKDDHLGTVLRYFLNSLMKTHCEGGHISQYFPVPSIPQNPVADSGQPEPPKED